MGRGARPISAKRSKFISVSSDREMIGRSFTELADAYIWVGRFRKQPKQLVAGSSYLEGDISANRVRLLSVLWRRPVAATGDLSRLGRRCGKL